MGKNLGELGKEAFARAVSGDEKAELLLEETTQMKAAVAVLRGRRLATTRDFALRWAHAECGRWRGDPSRMAVGGDSAGGNLSAAAAAALTGDPACPKVALLIYGVFDFVNFGQAQPAETSPGVEISTEDTMDKMTELMVGSYLGSDRSDELLHDPRLSPLYAAAKLPPSHVVVGSEDPLVAQTESMVKALEAEGVEHEYFVDEGMPHGYIQMEFLPPTRPSIDRMVDFLRRKL